MEISWQLIESHMIYLVLQMRVNLNQHTFNVPLNTKSVISKTCLSRKSSSNENTKANANEQTQMCLIKIYKTHTKTYGKPKLQASVSV